MKPLIARSVAPGRPAAVARGDARHAGAAARGTRAAARRAAGRSSSTAACGPASRSASKALAEREDRTIGALLEKLLADYEARGGTLAAGAVPAAEARAGRTRELRVWCTPSVFQAVPKLAAERGVLGARS